MAEKILNTKIRLLIKTYAEWEAIKGTFKPLRGEVCLCEIPAGSAEATTAPTVLFKVGDGLKTFGELKWASALAADVYAWAKKATPDWSDFPALPIEVIDTESGNFVTDIEYANNQVIVHRGNVGWGDIQSKPSLVNTVKATGDAEISMTPTTAASGDVTVTAAHAPHAAGDAKTASTQEISGYKGTGTIKIPKLVTNAYGHVTEIAEETVTITMPSEQVIDTGVHSVSLSGGTDNGTLKLTVDDTSTDKIKVTGLDSAAYVSVDSLNATAKGYADAVEDKLPTSADYGVLEVKAGTGIEVTGDAQRPVVGVKANTYDAHGAAAAVLGTSADTAAANTVYGAKAAAAAASSAAAAAQADATTAKTKIETFLGTITPDGSQDIIDTLKEINDYVGDHGEEFATLSGRVTNIENGTTTVPKATEADTLDGKHADDFADSTENGAKALAQGVKDVVDVNKAIWDKAGTALQAATFNSYIEGKSMSDAELKSYADGVSAQSVTDAKAELLGTDNDNEENKTILGAINYASRIAGAEASLAVQQVIGDTGDAAGSLTVYGAKAYADLCASETLTDANEYTAEKIGEVNDRIDEIVTSGPITQITTSEGKGLKVTGKSQIDIDDTVVFVFNCNYDSDTFYIDGTSFQIPEGGTWYGMLGAEGFENPVGQIITYNTHTIYDSTGTTQTLPFTITPGEMYHT